MSSRKIVPTTTNPTTVLHVTVAAIPVNLATYDRDDWKHWTDADGDCQDACNEALIAESRVSVSYRTDRRCRVATGQWLAPYTNTVATDPGKLDVDHMVPLGNAHVSGRVAMERRPTGTLRQPPGGSPAPDRRHGQRQPFEGRSRTRGVETR